VSIKVYEAYRVARGVDPYELLWEIKRRGQEAARERLVRMARDILDGRSHTEHLKLKQQDALFKRWLEKHHPGETTEELARNLLSRYSEWAEKECPAELRREPQIYAVGNDEVVEAGRGDPGQGIKPGVFEIDAWMMKRYGEQLTELRRHEWSLDTTVTMRRFRNRFYLIPYCDSACLLGHILDFMATDERLEEFGYWNNTDRPKEVTPSQWAWRSTVWTALTEHDRWPEFVAVDVVSWAGWSYVSPMMHVARERGIAP